MLGSAYERFADAHRESAPIARWTPVLTSASFSERCGGTVALKAECLQRTGSFKLRGALNKLRSLPSDCSGVVAGSAGNHAQSLAYAARHYGIPCEVFMPDGAAVNKLAAVRAFGATVYQEGDSVDDCVALAQERGAQAGLTFVHPFDDEQIITGQAGVGVELVEDVPSLAKVVIPVGGGGLASGTALALKARQPDVQIVGVQAVACAPFPESLQQHEAITASAKPTIADGIAIKRPGGITLPLIDELLDDVVTVDDEAIADAMVLLLERSKLVVEGAGAAAAAALLTGAVQPASTGTTVAVLSGGNVDPELLGIIAVRGETRAGRRRRLFTRISDRPGGLAAMLASVAKAEANVITVEHVRDGVPLAVRETGVVVTVETRGDDHLAQLLEELRAHGYEVREDG
jgi:threonine dehydratase